jgi:hypothetical protein
MAQIKRKTPKMALERGILGTSSFGWQGRAVHENGLFSLEQGMKME